MFNYFLNRLGDAKDWWATKRRSIRALISIFTILLCWNMFMIHSSNMMSYYTSKYVMKSDYALPKENATKAFNSRKGELQ